MITISKRLKQIALLVPQGSRLADIGSDHALLPVYLVQQGKIESAIAGELNPGPYAAAAKQVREAGLSGQIDVRNGDGLSVLKDGEADVAVIAGMGGHLIARILGEGIAALPSIRRLILQPNVGEEAVRQWLLDNGWFLEQEHIMEEDGKIYEILAAIRSEEADEANQALYCVRPVEGTEGIMLERADLISMGPYLVQEVSPVFVAKWEREIDKLVKVSDQLANSRLEASEAKQEQINKRIDRIKEVLQCLQKAKRLSS
nr:class I SAM-dependent methyltransferase [Aneurinibacillus sp. XH2]